jgi:hypothetical protein
MARLRGACNFGLRLRGACNEAGLAHNVGKANDPSFSGVGPARVSKDEGNKSRLRATFANAFIPHLGPGRDGCLALRDGCCAASSG